MYGRPEQSYAGPTLSVEPDSFRGFRMIAGSRAKFYQELNQKLSDRGFSDDDIRGLYADIEKQGIENLLGDAATKRTDEFSRRLIAYVDEQNALFSRVKEQEQELLREDRMNREQEEYDKEVAETSRISIQESGQRAEKARQAQKSREYLEAQRGGSGRSSGRIAVRRPM